MHPSRVLALASLLVLLAGCSSSPPASVGETGEDGSAPEGGRSTGAADVDTVRVLDHEFDYELNDAAPPTTMEVPANGTTLYARFSTSTTAPCGVTLGEPEDPFEPGVVFVSPSGKRNDLPATPTTCRVGPLAVNPAAQTLVLEAEPGAWDVEFTGRGLSAHAHLVVEAQLG